MNFLAVIHNGAHRGDDRRRAAQAALGKFADLCQLHGALLHLHAEIILRHLQQAAPGDGGENGVGLGGDQLAVLGDENHVGAAGLLDVGAGSGIHVDVLVVALLMGVHNVVKAHGVVQTGLHIAGALGRRPVEIGDAQLQGLDAALEIGADRGDEHPELILRRGLDADDGVAAEHERTDVQRRAGAVGRHPLGVCADGLHYGLHEPVLGEHGHFQAAAGTGHPLGVQVRAEADDASILGGVGFQPLKAGLGVLQNAGALTHGNGGLIGQAAVIPLAVSEIGDIAHVGLDVAKSQIAPVNIFSFHCKHLSEILFPNSSTAGGASQAFGAEKSISYRDICLFQRNPQKPPLLPPFFLRKTPKGTCIQYGKVVKYRKAPQKKGLRVMDIVRHPGEDLFFEAILSLRTLEDCRLFFEDVATIKELQAMSQRFRVACLLDSGENYIEVSESTGASSATISRVNRCLVYGGGYRTALDRLKESGVLPEGEEK